MVSGNGAAVERVVQAELGGAHIPLATLQGREVVCAGRSTAGAVT